MDGVAGTAGRAVESCALAWIVCVPCSHRYRTGRPPPGAICFGLARLVQTAFSFVPIDVGSANRHLQEQRPGSCEVASFGGDAKLQQAMAADSIDVGLGSGPALAFVAKGCL